METMIKIPKSEREYEIEAELEALQNARREQVEILRKAEEDAKWAAQQAILKKIEEAKKPNQVKMQAFMDEFRDLVSKYDGYIEDDYDGGAYMNIGDGDAKVAEKL